MKIPKIYIWLTVFVAVACAVLTVFAPTPFWEWKNILIMTGCAVVFFAIAQFVMTRVGQDIPRSAVLELLDKCESENGGEWVLAHFKPRISLEEAQLRLGPDYTQKVREGEFMIKASAVHASRSDIVVFYSKRKGLLCARSDAIRFLLQNYGRFMMDNWNSLLGAMAIKKFFAQNLDGGQSFTSNGQYLGSIPDE